ncbi:hypothetical protein CCM_04635 [Cordyceps militaris CM01]|uniref:Uncharacterized protein n=1 Tax=Cordyceps militaris (strain CM01) TaxID=983644 RepID=G3JGD2_CORMM|nr:uncharacterized protein CCM_04635 [Cordyceps militaris CM01]EGX93262.1 hypothetical protein CCM_04635 [Cordyceps militaris CM01]
MALQTLLRSQETQFVLTGILAYYAILSVLHQFMKRAFRGLYLPLLEQLGTRKTLQLLVFLIGVAIALTTAPLCGHAFLSYPASQNGFSTSPLTLDSKVCVGARVVMWIAEMPLLGGTHFYLVHHILSLTSLGIVLSNKLNMAPIYLIYAGLVTEVFSSSRAFIRMSGLHHKHPKLFTHITSSNAVAILLLRALPAAYLLQTQLFRPALATNVGLAYFITVVFYACFVTYIAYKLLAGQGYVSLKPASPAHFALKNGSEIRKISVYSVLLGAAIAATELSAATMYELASGDAFPRRELSNLAAVGLGTVVSGLLGAKFMNQVLSVPVGRLTEEQKKSVAPPPPPPAVPGVSPRFFPGYKGISIQGAILFSALWLNVCPLLGLQVNHRILFGAVGMSLPVGEAIGRVGCYFAGCCGSTRKEKYPAIQLLAAALNTGIFGLKVMDLANQGTSKIGDVGLAAVLANGAVRLVLNPLRSDTAEMLFSPASMFALSQILLSSSLLTLERTGGGMDPLSALVAVAGATSTSIFLCRIAALAWEMAATELKKWKLSQYARMENFVYAFSIAIFMLVTKSNAGGEVARAGRLFLRKESLLVMSSPALLGSIFAAAGLPIILLN